MYRINVSERRHGVLRVTQATAATGGALIDTFIRRVIFVSVKGGGESLLRVSCVV